MPLLSQYLGNRYARGLQQQQYELETQKMLADIEARKQADIAREQATQEIALKTEASRRATAQNELLQHLLENATQENPGLSPAEIGAIAHRQFVQALTSDPLFTTAKNRRDIQGVNAEAQYAAEQGAERSLADIAKSREGQATSTLGANTAALQNARAAELVNAVTNRDVAAANRGALTANELMKLDPAVIQAQQEAARATGQNTATQESYNQKVTSGLNPEDEVAATKAEQNRRRTSSIYGAEHPELPLLPSFLGSMAGMQVMSDPAFRSLAAERVKSAFGGQKKPLYTRGTTPATVTPGAVNAGVASPKAAGAVGFIPDSRVQNTSAIMDMLQQFATPEAAQAAKATGFRRFLNTSLGY